MSLPEKSKNYSVAQSTTEHTLIFTALQKLQFLVRTMVNRPWTMDDGRFFEMVRKEME